MDESNLINFAEEIETLDPIDTKARAIELLNYLEENNLDLSNYKYLQFYSTFNGLVDNEGYLKEEYKNTVENKNNILNEETEILEEATKSISKRDKITNFILECIGIVDRSKLNVEKYKRFFESMSDSEFKTYMDDFTSDPNKNFYLELLPNKSEPSIEDIEKLLKRLGIPKEEYVYFRHDGDKDDPMRSREECSVGYVNVRRLQQILSKKNTYSLDIDSRNVKNGQVSGADKIARISDAELYGLSVYQADAAIKEFYGSRADNMVAKADLYSKISKFGYVYLDDLQTDKSKNQTLNTINTYLLGAGIKSNMVEDDKEKARDEIKRQIMSQELEKMGGVKKEETELLNEDYSIDNFLLIFDKPKEVIFNRELKLYHGSAEEFDVIKTFGVNVGATKFSSPRWSTFCWDNEENAYRWAVFQGVRRHAKGLWSLENKGMMLKSDVEKCLGQKAYVYSFTMKASDVAVGSSPAIKEYTVDKEIIPDSVKCITLTEEIIKDNMILVEDINVLNAYKNIKPDSSKFQRNKFFQLILDPIKDAKRRKIYKDIRSGKIQVLDSLKGYKKIMNEDYELLNEDIPVTSYYVCYPTNRDNGNMNPYIPNNFLTKNKFADNKTPRVIACNSIAGFLMSLGKNINGKKFYVHKVITDEKPRIPTTSESPTHQLTGEVWFMNPVKLKCIGDIIVTGDDGKGNRPYVYGLEKNTGSLKGWSFKWLNKFNIEEKPAVVSYQDYIKKEETSMIQPKYGYIAINEIEAARGFIDYELTEECNGKYINLTLEGLESFIESNNLLEEYKYYIKVPISDLDISLYDESSESAILNLPFSRDIKEYKEFKRRMQ